MTMFCRNCGQRIQEGSVYCPRCGERLNGETAPEPSRRPASGEEVARLRLERRGNPPSPKRSPAAVVLRTLALIAALALVAALGVLIGRRMVRYDEPAASTPSTAEPASYAAATPVPLPSVTPVPAEAEAAAPADGAYLEAYRELLREEAAFTAQTQAEQGGWGGYSSEYILYDIDKDSVPELIIKRGTCEADYTGTVYTLRAGEILTLGEIHLGHGGVATWPGENAMLHIWGHMGYQQMSKVCISGTGLTEELIFEEDINQSGAEYTSAGAVVPGSGALYLSVPSSNELLLSCWQEVIDWAEGRGKAPATAAGWPNEDPDFYMKLVDTDGLVQMSDREGQLAFSELMRSGTLYQYTDGDLSITDTSYADFNLDGSMDCLLCLNDGTEYGNYGLLLNCEDGVTYGYFIYSMRAPQISPDGTVSTSWSDSEAHTTLERFFFSGKDFFTLYLSN